MSRKIIRRALNTWYWYLLPIALLVGVMAFDSWLNIETRRNDYEVAKLKRRAQELTDAREKLVGQGAASQQLHLLQEKALEMGLRAAEPWQVRTVPMQKSFAAPGSFELAMPIAKPQVAPEIPVTVVARAAAAPPPAPVVEAEPAPAPEQAMVAQVVQDPAPDPEMETLPLLESLDNHVDAAVKPAPQAETAPSTNPLLEDSPESMLAL